MGSEHDDIYGKSASTSSAKDQLIRRLLRGGAIKFGEDPVTSASSAPLSFQQEQMWLVQEIDPADSTYNFTSAFLIGGQLDFDVLQKSLELLIIRHAALRAQFRKIDGAMEQFINDAATVPIERLLFYQSQRSDFSAVHNFVRSRSKVPFDLEHDIPLRVSLLDLGSKQHVLVIVVHHASTDMWSHHMVVSELCTIYGLIAEGAPVLVSRPMHSYLDFARWQRANHRAGLYSKDLEFWRHKLEAPIDVLSLPLRATSGNFEQHEGGVTNIVLSDELSEAVARTAREQSCSSFAVVVAAWIAVLRRCCTNDDMVAGLVTSNRGSVKFESTVGNFVAALPLRIQVAGSPTFLELLEVVRDTIIEVYEHSAAPFQIIVQDSPALRSRGRLPFLNVLFNSYLGVQQPTNMGRLSFERLETQFPSLNFPMTIYVLEKLGRLRIRTIHQRALFDDEWIQQLGERSERLLRLALADNNSIYAYDLRDSNQISPPADHSRLRPFDYDLDVVSMFYEQVRSNPASVAVSAETSSVTYSTLFEIAWRVSEVLTHYGVANGDVIGICGEKCAEFYAVMIGVLLAKAVFFTIDDSYSADRRRELCRIANCKRVWYVSNSNGSCSCGGDDAFDITSLHMDFDLVIHPPTDVWRPERSWPDLGYIFFTSGSTSEPLAVAGRRASLGHFVNWQRGEWSINRGDRFGQLTAPGFDVFLRDVFTPLCAGATICVPPNKVDPLAWLYENQISVLHAVPSLMESWLRNEPGVKVRSLKALFFAGEPLMDSLISKCRTNTFQNSEIINLYGTTESTLASCYYRIPASPTVGVQPVGHPIPNTEILLKNSYGVDCSTGEVGEVSFVSDFLSDGYINNEIKNSDRFRNIKVGSIQRRAFRTGDFGRLRADGNLELLGRLDDQVKIAGVRISLFAVTSILNQHPDIQSAAVYFTQDEEERDLLIAAIASDRRDVGFVREIVRFLKNRLADPSVPRRYAICHDIPTNANGKVDRQKLLALSSVASSTFEDDYSMSDTELKVARLWSKVLGVKGVDRLDDFFELGGYSLLATRLIGDIEELFNIRISLRSFFDNATIAGISAIVDQVIIRIPQP